MIIIFLNRTISVTVHGHLACIFMILSFFEAFTNCVQSKSSWQPATSTMELCSVQLLSERVTGLVTLYLFVFKEQ